MRVSVIIPTFNRAEILRRSLQGYAKQSSDHQMLELLVVNDGSKDHTASVVEEFSRSFPVPLRYLHQVNSGLSAARNHAIRESRGDLLLLGDDDIIPTPTLVAEHVAWHVRHPEPNVGVLGHVAWSKELRPTPFMEWSGLYGPQFNFGYFKPGGDLDFRFGYFCNTSVKASFLRENGVFSEAFRTYGYEDLELAYRLTKKGYRLIYSGVSLGYHYKYETFEDTRKRVEKLYQSWPEFSKTEAGKRFLALYLADRTKSAAAKSGVKKLFSPLKGFAMPLLKPLLDTHVPLPIWLYEQVFYHYVTPFLDVVRPPDNNAREVTGAAGLI